MGIIAIAVIINKIHLVIRNTGVIELKVCTGRLNGIFQIKWFAFTSMIPYSQTNIKCIRRGKFVYRDSSAITAAVAITPFIFINKGRIGGSAGKGYGLP